ncbi:hypothetical protein BASA62_007423 [Batrachochytrium salamandrivorans]|nr:hypothetical protein BASA62_007423 [Batrachochytrium salamandrivorans]
MKLISFAALSFLAITVSAWPPNNHDAKDAEQHQSDRDQSAPQPLGIRAPMLHNYYQQFLQTELEKLHKEHQEKKGLLDDMKDVVKAMEQELNALGGEISKCVEGL